MSTAILRKRVDRLLQPFDFERTRLTWTRSAGELTDVVNLQVSKSGDEVTINAGVLDPEVYAYCWGKDPPPLVDDTPCTVRARIGDLRADRLDLWWPIVEPETPEQVAEALSRNVVPFLESMHSREAMARWLERRPVAWRKYPPENIYLAILRHLAGDVAGACSLLDELHRKALGDWKEGVLEVSARLGCP